MILGHGVDIVEIQRIRRIISKYGNRFIEKIFGEAEIMAARFLKDPGPFFASRFAAKEAFAKALGTGFSGFGFRDVVVLRGKGKPPGLSFSEKLQSLHPDANPADFALSLSHEKKFAIASVIWKQDN